MKYEMQIKYKNRETSVCSVIYVTIVDMATCDNVIQYPADLKCTTNMH